jgi:hypothetical protein
MSTQAEFWYADDAMQNSRYMRTPQKLKKGKVVVVVGEVE